MIAGDTAEWLKSNQLQKDNDERQRLQDQQEWEEREEQGQRLQEWWEEEVVTTPLAELR